MNSLMREPPRLPVGKPGEPSGRRAGRVTALAPLVALAALAAAGSACAAPVTSKPAVAVGTDAAAPDSFTVRFLSSRGAFDVRVHRDWAPRGADRIYSLARARYFDGVRFFRVVPGFVAQFGLSGDTAVTRAWRGTRIPDDTARKSNVRGTLSFAAGGANTRTTQLFINFGDNSRLDTLRFAVFGQVTAGMDAVVDSLYKGYGEAAPRGQGPSQDSIGRQGNAYLIRGYPKLDHVISARIVQEWKHR